MTKTKEQYQKECDRLLGLARAIVQKDGPYFSSVLYALVPIATFTMDNPMAVTADMRFFYNPQILVDHPEFSALSSDNLPRKMAGMLVHEVMHVMRDLDRVAEMAKVHPDFANLAADMAINPELRDAGWSMPDAGVYPEHFGFPRNQTMEQYFGLLMKKRQEFEQKLKELGFGDGGGEGGDTEGDEQDESDQEGKDGKNKSEHGKHDHKKKKPGVGSGGCTTSCSHTRDNLAKQLAETAGDAKTQHEVQRAVKAAHAAAQQHFGRGTVPGWVIQDLSSIDGTGIRRDWQKELRHVVRRTGDMILGGGMDYSMRRPSKRSQEFALPTLVDQQLVAAMAIDTSGSMGEEELNYAKDVVVGFLANTGTPHIYSAQFDTKVQVPFQRMHIREVGRMSAQGRGGTDFRPIFEAVQKLRPRPNLFMVLTDGDGPAPEQPPKGIEVIWVIVPSPWSRVAADWGKTIVCTDDDEAFKRHYNR